MEKIKNFITEFINKEREAVYYQGYKEKLEDYNKAVRELNSFASELMLPLMREHDSPPFSERFYEEVIEFEEPTLPRYLFKISEYENENYGNVWACYVSGPNPSATVKRISDCFLVATIEDTLKIIAKMGIDPNTNKWTFYGGDENKNLRLHNLGSAIKIERFVEPTNEESLKEYLIDS